LDLFLTESDLMKVFASIHIMVPFWEDLEKHGFIKSTTLKWKSNGSMVRIAGRVIIIHTPPTKSGKRVMFLTLEDEDGLFDLTVFEDVHTRYAKKILASSVLLVEGVLNRFGLRGVSVVARRFWTLREFYDQIYNDSAKIFSPALPPKRDRSSPQRSLRQKICPDSLSGKNQGKQSASVGGYNHLQYPEQSEGCLFEVNPPPCPACPVGRYYRTGVECTFAFYSTGVRDKNISGYESNERPKHEKDTGGHGILDRQDPDQKRHLLPEASHYRGKPA